MGEVVKMFPADDPDCVLERAKGVYKSVFVVGWDDNGEEVLWLIEKFKALLLSENACRSQ